MRNIQHWPKIMNQNARAPRIAATSPRGEPCVSVQALPAIMSFIIGLYPMTIVADSAPSSFLSPTALRQRGGKRWEWARGGLHTDREYRA